MARASTPFSGVRNARCAAAARGVMSPVRGGPSGGVGRRHSQQGRPSGAVALSADRERRPIPCGMPKRQGPDGRKARSPCRACETMPASATTEGPGIPKGPRRHGPLRALGVCPRLDSRAFAFCRTAPEAVRHWGECGELTEAAGRGPCAEGRPRDAQTEVSLAQRLCTGLGILHLVCPCNSLHINIHTNICSHVKGVGANEGPVG